MTVSVRLYEKASQIKEWERGKSDMEKWAVSDLETAYFFDCLRPVSPRPIG